MKTVAEVSRISGISVRTLHHYDTIGLLPPARVTEAGYRLYDDRSLERLNAILLLRELRFSLKQIKEILDSPGFDPIQALDDQIRLLELERSRLDELISHARSIQKKGVFTMNFKPYDRSQQEAWAKEAKQRWGKTGAYREFEEKTAGKSDRQMQDAGEGLMAIFGEFGQIRSTDPAGQAAQALVARLQNYITDHYYTCTSQILRGLGQMYIAGDSMTDNINAAGGEGTAEFVHRAIEVFCK
ncbi:MAG: MerR family transcriptional regulator [Oscillospiraceae bacterium]|nr:MerR family transcriptional regulator [Oscillospiraceae bacterium]